MACCSEYQNECLRVVTMAYLTSLVGSDVKDVNGNTKIPSHSKGSTYCPTYGELTGGGIIPYWSEGSSPFNDIDGIFITGSYASNQLVRQQDLQVKYTKFKTLTISRRGSGNIPSCGGNATLRYTYNYERHVKSMDSSCNTSDASETVTGKCSELTYHATYGSVSNCTTYSVERNGYLTTTHSSRCDDIYADVTFRGELKTSNTIKICQDALGDDGCSTYSGSTYDRVSATPYGDGEAWRMSWNDCDSHSFYITATGYGTNYYYTTDDCGTEYHDYPFTCSTSFSEALCGGGGGISCYVSGPGSVTCSGTAQFSVSKAGGGSGGVCDSGSFSAHDCCDGADSDSETLYTPYWHGLRDWWTFSRTCSDCSSDKDKCPDPEEDNTSGD